MESLSTLWTSLTPQRKVAVVLATVLTFVAVFFVARMGEGRNMSLLYGGLEGAAAGDVLQALEAAGVAHEVRGSSIFVDATQRDSLRMSLASQGLPATSTQGYELLDSLSGFSTTTQMFDAAYWRAREGELARTIVSSPFVTSARVHISAPAARGFQREQKPTAAVTVSTTDGSLSASQARAFRYLVASSVPGLLPQDVAVIDSLGNLISSSDENGTSPGQDLSAELRDRVQRLLEARVGVGNAVVEVSVETVTQSEQIVERLIDPESRIAISTDVTENTNTSQNSGGGDVTVASNLPDGDGAGGNDSSSAQGSETRQITNFEVSQTQREIMKRPGDISRITVAAMINTVPETDENGAVVETPRPAEELDTLQSLIASAVGFSEARGDEITIQSLTFQPVESLGTEITEGDIGGTPLDTMGLILGLFVVRPILMSGNGAQADGAPLALPSGDPGQLTSDANGLPDTGDVPGNMDLPMLDNMPTFSLDDLGSDSADPVDRLREMIDERQDETLQILQSWIDGEPEERESA